MKFCVGGVGAVCKACLLAFTNANRRTAARRFTFAPPHCDHSSVGVRVHIKSIIAGLGNCECLIRSVDLVSFTVIQPAHMQVHCSLVQLQLGSVLVDIREGEAAFGIDPNESCAKADFSP
jgi:hypothetical protein